MRKARKYALDILYSAELSGKTIAETIESYATMSGHLVPDYSKQLAHGVVDHEYLIDAFLAPSLAQDWTIERMPAVDRALARIAVYEMVYAELAAAIAISEAVSLAEELSTESSPSFLTGVLGHAARVITRTDEKDESGER